MSGVSAYSGGHRKVGTPLSLVSKCCGLGYRAVNMLVMKTTMTVI